MSNQPHRTRDGIDVHSSAGGRTITITNTENRDLIITKIAVMTGDRNPFAKYLFVVYDKPTAAWEKEVDTGFFRTGSQSGNSHGSWSGREFWPRDWELQLMIVTTVATTVYWKVEYEFA